MLVNGTQPVFLNLSPRQNLSIRNVLIDFLLFTRHTSVDENTTQIRAFRAQTLFIYTPDSREFAGVTRRGAAFISERLAEGNFACR
jgi:hypothetical protein